MLNITSTLLPNPDTPLAFLDPKVAYQTSVSIYVLAGSAGVSLVPHTQHTEFLGCLGPCKLWKRH